MPFPIAIEVTPPDAPREHVSALLVACTRASANTECVPASDVLANSSSAVAIVTWNSERRVVIEVGLRKDGRAEWLSRTLDFRSSDGELERWRTIGFVVGTLSRGKTGGHAELEEGTTPSSRGELPVAPDSRERPRLILVEEDDSSARSRSRSRSFGIPAGTLDLGAALGPAIGGVRAGGLVRTGIRLVEPLRAVFSVRYLDRPIGKGEESVGGRWITGSAGLGIDLFEEPLSLTIFLDGRGEYFEARAVLDDEERSAGKFLPGVGLGFNAGWMSTQGFGLFVGVDGAAMLRNKGIEVQQKGNEVATDSALNFNGEAGFRFRLW